MADSAGMLASDAEREDVALALREHYAAGRLDSDELALRLERVYAARTVEELAGQRQDLPDLPATRSQQRARLTDRRASLRRALVQQTGGSLGLFGGGVAIWLASGANGSFWPQWLLIMPTVFLVRNLWRLYGPSPEIERVERELRRGVYRHGRHRRHRRGHYYPDGHSAEDGGEEDQLSRPR